MYCVFIKLPGEHKFKIIPGAFVPERYHGSLRRWVADQDPRPGTYVFIVCPNGTAYLYRAYSPAPKVQIERVQT